MSNSAQTSASSRIAALLMRTVLLKLEPILRLEILTLT